LAPLGQVISTAYDPYVFTCGGRLVKRHRDEHHEQAAQEVDRRERR
jgi:hypothetical protein